MSDIYIALAVMSLISVILFFCAGKLVKVCPKKYFPLLLFAAMMFIPLNYIFKDSYMTLSLLPFSGVVVFTTWILPGAALLAGLLWGKVHKKKIRRYFYVLCLFIAGFYGSYQELFIPRPPAGHKKSNGIFLQSSQSSCTAACAATLLSFYGIHASEKEMIELCLTTKNGTSIAGLYRGLMLETKETDYDVKVEKWTLPRLLDTKFPVIIQVGLKKNSDVDPCYAKKWGWTPGVSHSVIFMGRTKEEKVKIADPSVGVEEWNIKGIKELWHGYVVYLKKNKGQVP